MSPFEAYIEKDETVRAKDVSIQFGNEGTIYTGRCGNGNCNALIIFLYPTDVRSHSTIVLQEICLKCATVNQAVIN